MVGIGDAVFEKQPLEALRLNSVSFVEGENQGGHGVPLYSERYFLSTETRAALTKLINDKSSVNEDPKSQWCRTAAMIGRLSAISEALPPRRL